MNGVIFVSLFVLGILLSLLITAACSVLFGPFGVMVSMPLCLVVGTWLGGMAADLTR